MSDLKFKAGDEVIIYPFEENPVIHTVIHPLTFNRISPQYLIGNPKELTTIMDAYRLRLVTPEMKTKILLGIDLDE